MGRTRRAVVFLVEDDDDLRASFADVLENDGYIVLPARDGHEALARMRGMTLPAVAVVDLVMPDMNGWELVRAMQADPALGHIPIVVVSSRRRPRVQGVRRVIEKPCSPGELVTVVQELMPVGRTRSRA